MGQFKPIIHTENPFFEYRSYFRIDENKHIMCRISIIGIIVLGSIFFASPFALAVNQTHEDPIIGTYEYTAGDYVEAYSFLADSVFEAEGLGKQFNGTWEKISDLEYRATFREINSTDDTNMTSDIFLYDPKTDLLWYPAHHRKE